MTAIRRTANSDCEDSPSFGVNIADARNPTELRSRQYIATVRHLDGPIYGWSELRRRFQRIAAGKRNDRICLYRHGATNYNRKNLVSGQHDTMLSDEGREQAYALRASLPEQIDLIVCSALFRSVQTMELSVPAEKRAHIPVLADARLNEVNLGVLQGKRRRYLPEFDNGNIDYAPDAGESYREAAHRVLSVIVDVFDRLADRGSPPRYATLFCHAGVLRIIATLTTGSDDPKDVFKINLANAECLTISADQVSLPSYWVEQGSRGARKHT